MREEYINSLIEHYELTAGAPPDGDTIDIAILDSVNEASESFREYNEVGRECNAINAQGTTEHGHGTASVLTRFAGNIRTHYYQTIHQNGEFRDRDLLQSFGVIRHVTDEIDIFNLSAGLDHAARPGKDCSRSEPSCKVCRVLEDILDEHTVFVAAAGDRLQTDDLVCPAISPEVISTGGAVAKCNADFDNDQESQPLGLDLESLPPNAFWIKRDDHVGAQGTYCTNRGCFPGTGCLENRQYEPWNQNHDSSETSPNILSPVHFPMEDEVGPLLAEGSSYSAPVVASQIANALSAIRILDAEPTKGQIKRVIEEETKGCFDGSPGMLCGVEFSKGLGEPFGFEFELEDDDEDLIFTTIGMDS